jgi:hypothetical protein
MIVCIASPRRFTLFRGGAAICDPPPVCNQSADQLQDVFDYQ